MQALFALFLVLLTASAQEKQQQQQQFRGCEFPALEWTAISGGTGSQFYTRDAHVLGNQLVVVGELSSYLGDYELMGPIRNQEQQGTETTKTLSKTIESTDIEPQGDVNIGTTAGYDIGINVIDIRTGEPVEALTLNNALGDSQMNSVGAAQIANSGKDIVAIGGRFRGQIHLNSTNSCTLRGEYETSEYSTRFSVDCANNGTLLTSHFKPGVDSSKLTSGDYESSIIGNQALLISLTTNRDAKAGNNDWLLEYNWAKLPWTGNYASEVSSTTVSSKTGDVFAGGKHCFNTNAFDVQPTPTGCTGIVGRYASEDGATLWSQKPLALSDVYGIEYDETNELLFFTGFQEALDEENSDEGDRRSMQETMGSQLIGAMNATNGEILWYRTLNNENNLGTFQNGEVKIAHESDGPYIYTVLSVATDSESVDTGTPYAACKKGDGSFIPSYEVVQDRFLIEADCVATGLTFVPSTSPDAIPPQTVPSGVVCTANGFTSQGCTIKLHKFTGRPMWATSKVQPRAMEASAAGPIVSGSFRQSRGSFDGLIMRDLGNNEAFQALLDKDTGEGVYVQHFYDYETHFHGNAAAIDFEGNYYIAARSNPARLMDGDELNLSFPEPGAFNSVLVALKLDTKPEGATRSPSCLMCDNNVRTSIKSGFCFVDEICFADGETGNTKLGDGAVVCDAELSQTDLQDFGGEEDPIGCNICGEDGFVTKPDALFDASMFGGYELDCNFLDLMGQSGNLQLETLGLTCSDVQNLLAETCGCETKQTTTEAPTTPAVAPVSAPLPEASIAENPCPKLNGDCQACVTTESCLYCEGSGICFNTAPDLDFPDFKCEGTVTGSSNVCKIPEPAAAIVDKGPISEGLSTGAIVGITLAGVVVLGIVAGILGRQKLSVNVNVKRKPDESVVAQGDTEANVHETDSSALQSSAKSDSVI